MAAGYGFGAMKLRRILVTFGCWLFGVVVAQARIGETVKECEERYGKPVRVLKDRSMIAYVKSPLLPLLHFTDGKCDEISYVKAELDSPDAREELSEDERDLLQIANGGNRAWRRSQESRDNTICCETTDGEFGSVYVVATRTLIIMSRERYKWYIDRVKSQEKSDIKGF
jgi:hypothetical protein